jgi:hypothetical protein
MFQPPGAPLRSRDAAFLIVTVLVVILAIALPIVGLAVLIKHL